MDTSTVYAIAKELGIAIDSAQEFIDYILPQMASYNVFLNSMWLSAAIIINLILITLIVIGVKRDWDDALFIITVGEVFVGIISLILIPISIVDIVGWSNYPEVMLFNQIVS